jgi:transmembrane sensor
MEVGASNQTHADPRVAREAAEWFINLQGADSREQQEAFADWLRRSPVHVEEFLQLTALHGDLARLPDLNELDRNTPVAGLDLPSADDNIISVSFGSEDLGTEAMDTPTAGPARRSVRPRSSRIGFAVAAAIGLITLGAWLLTGPAMDFFGKDHYNTGIGEQRSLTLADGSRVDLNARSTLSAMVNASVRDLRLNDGEALFSVAKDAAHPFRVHTPEATIEAKGTRFNVYVSNGETVVSLLEGHVLVTPPVATPVLLNPGEQVAIARNARTPPKPRAADVRTAIAWTEHRLVFEDAPLSDVIAEFNRYSLQPFSIEDPSVRDVRITGSFDSGSAQTFADSLAVAGSLRVTHQKSGAFLIEPK